MEILNELVYLAAPYNTPEERAFNVRLAELMRAYNYPLFMQEELADALATGVNPYPESIPSDFANEPTLMQTFSAVRMDLLNRANLVVAVYHGSDFDAVTSFEVGYALARRTNVVAVCSTENPGLPKLSAPLGTVDTCMDRLTTPHLCSRIVFTPFEEETFADRLIPILNRYFVPHRL